MSIDELLEKACETLKPGQQFRLRAIGADCLPVGEVVECRVVEVRETKPYPVILAHVGDTQDVTMLCATTEEVEGATVVAVIGVCGSDAEEDYRYPAAMLSDHWAGALLMVLD